MKVTKKFKIAHTPNTKMGMGDYYGTGVKQKVGTTRENSINGSGVSKKVKKPPSSLA